MASADQPPRTWHAWAPALLLLAPVLLLLVAVSWPGGKSHDARQACLAAGTALTAVSGTLRMASGRFFVVDGTWRVFESDCHGKTVQQCYRDQPGRRVLRDSLGAPVTVEFCEQHPVAYTVRGVRYTR